MNQEVLMSIYSPNRMYQVRPHSETFGTPSPSRWQKIILPLIGVMLIVLSVVVFQIIGVTLIVSSLVVF